MPEGETIAILVLAALLLVNMLILAGFVLTARAYTTMSEAIRGLIDVSRAAAAGRGQVDPLDGDVPAVDAEKRPVKIPPETD